MHTQDALVKRMLAMVLVFCLCTIPAGAKDKTDAVPLGNWAAVQSLEHGTSVSVRMTSGDRMDGKFFGLDPEGIRITIDKHERIFPRTGVAEIWQLRYPDRKLDGALIGMGVGAIAGIIAASTLEARWRGDDALGPSFVLAGIGIGAGLGVAGDAAIKGNKLLYPK